MHKITLTAIIILLFGFVGLSAQTVVLINGVPTKVKLNGSEIVKVLGVENNYLAGYATSQNEFQTVDPTDPTSAPTVASADTNPTTRSASNASSPATTQSSNSATTAFSGNYFKFDRNSALLSQLSINEIKDYAKKITSGQASSVILQSFYRTNSLRSEQLVKNRLDACKKYFELNGVSASAITTESIANDRQSDKVSITLQ